MQEWKLQETALDLGMGLNATDAYDVLRNAEAEVV